MKIEQVQELKVRAENLRREQAELDGQIKSAEARIEQEKAELLEKHGLTPEQLEGRITELTDQLETLAVSAGLREAPDNSGNLGKNAKDVLDGL